jgi:hypothetical protein
MFFKRIHAPVRMLFFLVGLCVAITPKVYAYIDPGTGGYFFGSGLGPLLIACASFVGLCGLRYLVRPFYRMWTKIWRFFRKK